MSVDTENKTFTILEGSVGTYPYRDVIFSSIVYEEDRFKGKSAMFTHVINRNSITSNLFFHGNVWCGIVFILRDGRTLGAYISEKETRFNSLQFHDDTRKAEEITSFMKKHRRYFKNIGFDTDSKMFTIHKGDIGSYSYKDIIKCRKEIENLNYYAPLQKMADISVGNFDDKVMIKLYFLMKDGNEYYVSISNEPVLINSRMYLIENRIGEEVVQLTKKIIKKYKE